MVFLLALWLAPSNDGVIEMDLEEKRHNTSCVYCALLMTLEKIDKSFYGVFLHFKHDLELS
jgi:hypothetical protein